LYRTLFAEPLPPLPLAEKLFPGEDEKEAEFVFIYDYACGALASLRARLSYMMDKNIPVPDSVACWAKSCKFIVDKFHFGSHKGMTKLPLTHHDETTVADTLPTTDLHDMMCSGVVCKKDCNPYIDFDRAKDGDRPPKRKISEFINSQIQEQSFKNWNKHKDSARKMHRSTFQMMMAFDLYYSTTR
jgi:hypothetical protein